MSLLKKGKATSPQPEPEKKPAFAITDGDRVEYFCRALKTTRDTVDVILLADKAWSRQKHIDALLERIKFGSAHRVYYAGGRDIYDVPGAERELREILSGAK